MPLPQFLYLTIKGRASGLPREIEIWFTQLETRYYVIAEYPTSKWLQNLKADPQVKVRVGEEAFPAEARILTPESDPERHSAVQALSVKKYGWGEGVIVELTPKSS